MRRHLHRRSGQTGQNIGFSGVQATVDEAAARQWLLDAPEGRPVSVQGHNSVVAYLTLAHDWLCDPALHLVQQGPVDEGHPFGTFTDQIAHRASDGLPEMGGTEVPPRWRRRDFAPSEEGEADRRRLVGAIESCLALLRADPARAASAGLWWTPLLVAGTVVVVLGAAAYAIYQGLTTSAQIHEDATSARVVRVVQATTDAFRDRLQVYRATGRMPPPSDLERNGLAQVAAMSDHFWENFATTTSKSAAWLIGALAVVWLLTSSMRSSRATAST